MAEENIDLQRSGHYPTVDLVADHSYSDVSGGRLGETTSRDSTIGLQLNIPIYQGGLVNSRTREARYQFEQALAAFEAQKRATQREVHDAYLGVISGISQVQALAQALQSTQTALEATEAGYEVGTRTAVDVLNAQSQLYSARRDYARARYDYILSTLGLKQAAGLLSEADCAQVSTLLVKPKQDAGVSKVTARHPLASAAASGRKVRASSPARPKQGASPSATTARRLALAGAPDRKARSSSRR